MTVDLQLAHQLAHQLARSDDMPADMPDDISDAAQVPCLTTVERWVTETFLAINRSPENVTIRVVGEEEMTELNQHYCGKNNPTNVLAFPFESVAEVDYASLGDIVICLAVVKRESNQQDKLVQSHFAHMVIHGMLHLCGFDHQTDEQAIAMEGVEKDILAKISMNAMDGGNANNLS